MGELVALIVFFSIVYSPKTEAVQTEPLSVPEAFVEPLPRDYVAAQAVKAGLSADLAVCIAEHESRFQPDALGDGHLTCPMTGEPQRSRGLFQISDCWHPEVPDEIAFSVASSTEWALARIQQGYAREWSTYGHCKRRQMAKAEMTVSTPPSTRAEE